MLALVKDDLYQKKVVENDVHFIAPPARDTPNTQLLVTFVGFCVAKLESISHLLKFILLKNLKHKIAFKLLESCPVQSRHNVASDKLYIIIRIFFAPILYIAIITDIMPNFCRFIQVFASQLFSNVIQHL